MPIKTLSTTASGSVGTTTYSWTFSQTAGSTISGTSLNTSTSNTVEFTTPSSITYAGTTSGTYKFSFTVEATDPGVSSCKATRTINLFYNDTPPSCNLAISAISVS